MSGDDAEEARGEPLRAARRESELVQVANLAATGDRRARDRLVELISTPVIRYCRARLGTAGRMHTAEDVAQDVLMAVCEALPRYRSNEVPPMAFVYGIARNKVADSFRAAGRDHSEPTDQLPDSVDTGVGPEAGAVRTAEVAQLRALLDKLPAAHREVLVLRVAMQFSADETAQAVGSTPGAVRVTQHRALAKLRTLLAEQMSGPVPGGF